MVDFVTVVGREERAAEQRNATQRHSEDAPAARVAASRSAGPVAISISAGGRAPRRAIMRAAGVGVTSYAIPFAALFRRPAMQAVDSLPGAARSARTATTLANKIAAWQTDLDKRTEEFRLSCKSGTSW